MKDRFLTDLTQGGNDSKANESGSKASGAGGQKGEKLAKGALFNYPVSGNSLLLKQLMKEAKGINCNNFPAAGTALLRSLIEAILKSIIDDQGANAQNKLLSLETALDICLGNTVQLGVDDKKILKEFKKNHLDYVSLGTHATVIPNALRTMAARDCFCVAIATRVGSCLTTTSRRYGTSTGTLIRSPIPSATVPGQTSPDGRSSFTVMRCRHRR